MKEATIDTMLTAHYPELNEFMGLIFFRQFVDEPEFWGFTSIYSGVRSRFCLNIDDGVGSIAASNCSGVDGEDGINDISNSLILWAEQGIPLGIRSPRPGVTAPPAACLAPNAPNPFNPRTTITFDLPREEDIVVAVYDLMGRRLRVLADGLHVSGRHEVTWNGRDAHGRGLASGTYIIRLEAESGGEARKVMLVR